MQFREWDFLPPAPPAKKGGNGASDFVAIQAGSSCTIHTASAWDTTGGDVSIQAGDDGTVILKGPVRIEGDVTVTGSLNREPPELGPARKKLSTDYSSRRAKAQETDSSTK